MSKSCCFFGHRDSPDSVRVILERAVISLIENESVNNFYIGNQGHFDTMAISILKKLTIKYPEIRYSIVLAYMPNKGNGFTDYSKTIYPEELEGVPLRFAIDRRNKWILDNSDYVIAYVNRPYGGAAKFYELAERRKKSVLNLYCLKDL